MDGIILKRIHVNKGYVEYTFEATGILKQYFLSEKLFIEYNEDMSDVPKSILVVPFVASILPLMWVTNTVMWVEEIDRTFYDSIFNVQAAYQRLFSHYKLKGNLVPARFVNNVLDLKRDSLLLFSGGLDANCTYVRIHKNKPLLFNIQGWYKTPTDTNVAAEADFRDIRDFAIKRNLDSSFAKSNFAVIVNADLWSKNIQKKLGASWWFGFQHSMAFISIAIPIAYKYGIGAIYIASSIPMGEYMLCASHVTTDSEFKYASSGKCVHDGSELVRQEKVKAVVDFQKNLGEPYPIRVCSFNDHNCCECEKCFRTVLGLVAELADVKDFGFDIDGPLKDHWSDVMYHRSGLMGFDSEMIHWPYIIPRMKENYDKMNQEQKDFVDWFLYADFPKMQKRSRIRYYKHNFLSILKRKLHIK